ncbi:MAG: DUF11 domain-containing protein, partial [Planctomycetales bacterium]|nr:DUF11 domain-containing protein [Planctomycetales bacterium]
TITATVAADATGNLVNTATVTAPTGSIEIDTANNTATDTDTIVRQVDLAVTKTDNVTTAGPGDVLNYVIVVTNNGPSDAVGAQVTDTFPAQLTSISFTSTAAGGATGNTASGTGNLSETLTLPSGASVTYQISATVVDSATTDILNTVTVAAPVGTTETDTANNTASDQDTLIPGVDLAITKTNGTTGVSAGRNTTYTIVVTNNGPNAVTGATVADTFSALLSNITYTSSVTGGATGNTASGTGNLNDTVNMPSGSTITYTVQALVDINAVGQSLVNTATVTAPNTVRELNPNNNSATDTDTIDELLAQLSGFVYVDLDDDGVFDANERGIAGVEIILEQNGAQIDTTTTGSDGSYAFADLAAGDYQVRETQPSTFRDGQETAAGGQGTVADDDLFSVTLAPGDNAQQLNFGEISLQPSKRDLLASRFA